MSISVSSFCSTQLQHRLYDTFREYPQIMVARQPSSSTHRTVTEELELISNAGNKLITTPFTSGLLTLDNQARVEQFVRARVRIRKHEYESGILSRQSTFDALRSMNTIINQYLYPTDTKESGETEAMTTKAKKEPRNRERREEAERKMAKLLAEKEEVDALLLELEAVTAKRADKAAVEEEVQALTKLIEQLRNRQQALATKVTANNADTENNDEHRTNEHDGARVGRHSLLEKLDVALKELQWTSYGAEHATYGVLTREILQRALAEDWELQHFKDEIERMEEEKQAVPQGLISLKNEEAALRVKRREMKGKDNSDSRASIYSSIRASRKKIQKEIKLVIAYKKQIDQRIAILHSFTQRIPRIVHFIKTDIHTDRFSLQNYLAVAAAHFMIKPDAIYYHMHPKTAAAQDRANNQWWDRCREYVTIVAEDDFVTQTRTGAPVRLAAHQADFLRVRYLIQEGGIYMDTDVLALRDFDDLLSNNVVFGAEKLVPR